MLGVRAREPLKKSRTSRLRSFPPESSSLRRSQCYGIAPSSLLDPTKNPRRLCGTRLLQRLPSHRGLQPRKLRVLAFGVCPGQPIEHEEPPVARLIHVELAVELCETEGKLRRSEEHTSELQSHLNLVCRLLLEKKKNTIGQHVQKN